MFQSSVVNYVLIHALENFEVLLYQEADDYEEIHWSVITVIFKITAKSQLVIPVIGLQIVKEKYTVILDQPSKCSVW